MSGMPDTTITLKWDEAMMLRQALDQLISVESANARNCNASRFTNQKVEKKHREKASTYRIIRAKLEVSKSGC